MPDRHSKSYNRGQAEHLVLWTVAFASAWPDPEGNMTGEEEQALAVAYNRGDDPVEAAGEIWNTYRGPGHDGALHEVH